MATTLGGVTLATPAEDGGVRITARDLGTEMDMADGSLRYDHIGTRRHWALRWRGVTSAQRDSLWARYGVRTTQAFSPPESASSYTVIVIRDTWEEESVTSGGTYYYDVGFEIEEQAAS